MADDLSLRVESYHLQEMKNSEIALKEPLLVFTVDQSDCCVVFKLLSSKLVNKEAFKNIMK